jgi:hypothetical protein
VSSNVAFVRLDVLLNQQNVRPLKARMRLGFSTQAGRQAARPPLVVDMAMIFSRELPAVLAPKGKGQQD